MDTIKNKLYIIIFEADTKGGRLFDLALIFCILFSTLIAMLESVEEVRMGYLYELRVVEWIITIIFTIEYIIRLYILKNKMNYVRSFYGMIDLMSILPTFIDLILPGTRYLTILRILRLLRIFRILKLFKYVRESSMLMHAIKNSKVKILVFVFAVLNIAFIFGSFMYVIEGPENGFTSIPRSVYWAIVTLSTVGYGDIAPGTVLGQILTTFIIILGYGIIAVPTGIISLEMRLAHKNNQTLTRLCQLCMHEGHDQDATFCKKCGGRLEVIEYSGIN